MAGRKRARSGSFGKPKDPAADLGLLPFSHHIDASQFSGRPMASRHAPQSGKTTNSAALPRDKLVSDGKKPQLLPQTTGLCHIFATNRQNSAEIVSRQIL